MRKLLLISGIGVVLLLGSSILMWNSRKIMDSVDMTQNIDQSTPALEVAIPFSAWVWEDVTKMSLSEIESLLNFANTEGITDLYVNVEPVLYIRESKESIQTKEDLQRDYEIRVNDFIGLATEKDIKVHALAGAENWIYDSHEYIPPFLITFVNEFNNNYEHKFNSFQFDIEFYNSSEFKKVNTSARRRHAQLYLEKIEAFLAQSNVPIGLAIPYWFNRDTSENIFMYKDNEGTMLYHLLELLKLPADSYLVLMSYRNSADGNNGTIKITQEAAELLKTYPEIDFYVGQETTDTVEDITFYGKTKVDFRREAIKIHSAFSSLPNYSGIAIHTLPSFMELE